MRRGSDGSALACIANFAGVPHAGYRVGLPYAGQWDEVLNTDAGVYAGSGVGNLGAVMADDHPWHARPASASVMVPPLGTVWLHHAAPLSTDEPDKPDEPVELEAQVLGSFDERGGLRLKFVAPPLPAVRRIHRLVK